MTITERVLGWVGEEAGTRVATPFLDVELFDSGPLEAPVALLLHGWPDDPSTWAKVWPPLNAAGLRTITP